MPIDVDCAAQLEARRLAEAEGTPVTRTRPDLNAPPPPCMLRTVRGRTDTSDRMDGETTIAFFVEFLQVPTGRLVLDKTGLVGSYRLNMNFDLLGARRGPSVAPAADAAPDIFTAIREQMWLKLESSRAQREALIIDRVERPTEN